MGFLLHAVCAFAAASFCPTSAGALSLDAAKWDFQYSPGMPAHPMKNGSAFAFQVPNANGVHYLTTQVQFAQPPHEYASAALAVTNRAAHARLVLAIATDNLFPVE